MCLFGGLTKLNSLRNATLKFHASMKFTLHQAFLSFYGVYKCYYFQLFQKQKRAFELGYIYIQLSYEVISSLQVSFIKTFQGSHLSGQIIFRACRSDSHSSGTYLSQLLENAEEKIMSEILCFSRLWYSSAAMSEVLLCNHQLSSCIQGVVLSIQYELILSSHKNASVMICCLVLHYTNPTPIHQNNAPVQEIV